MAQFWINAALRSVIWLGAAACLAYYQKPDGASVLAVRTDAIGWLAGGIVFAGLAFHFWSSVSLARGERQGAETSALVTGGPFRYVRNPIYLAGITLLVGVGLLYSTWRAVDLVLPLLLLLYLHVAVVWHEEPELRRRFGSKYEEVLPASPEVASCSVVIRRRLMLSVLSRAKRVIDPVVSLYVGAIER